VKVIPLAVHSPRAIEEALRSRGWDAGLAGDAAGGTHPAAFLVSGLEPPTVEALLRHAATLGLDIFTGDDWAILSGGASRLGALARPWVVPAPLADLATAIGTAAIPAPARSWRTARGDVSLEEPVLVGILNVTPDSFSDGGEHMGVGGAVQHADRLLEGGARIIDIGGESTRPGRTAAVAVEDELARTIPVVSAVVRRHPDLLVSIDTVKAEVARAALDAGAAIVNDVSAFRFDPAMADTVGAAGAGAILMHSRGGILEIASYRHASYPDGVVSAVLGELAGAARNAIERGIPRESIVVDPGLGFSKTPPQNLQLLDQLGVLLSLGHPLMVGASRKRFLAARPDDRPADRDAASAAACVLAWERGARLFRMHDTAGARAALSLAAAVDRSWELR
jgi:dihydropteroate synthase